jgi:TDG/mug DNA glycosylase family protein
LLAPNLLLVVCGTGVGNRSAQRRLYYAGPGNRFWETLSETKLTPRQLRPSEYGELLEYGIGLTDLVKHSSGGDHELRFMPSDRVALETRILECKPRILCFNGKRAAKEYFGVATVDFGRQKVSIGATQVYVAPSTSRAANGAWDIELWKLVARRSARL